jgi:hypothetical protein
MKEEIVFAQSQGQALFFLFLGVIYFAFLRRSLSVFFARVRQVRSLQKSSLFLNCSYLTPSRLDAFLRPSLSVFFARVRISE